jgi:hypothetical protein
MTRRLLLLWFPFSAAALGGCAVGGVAGDVTGVPANAAFSTAARSVQAINPRGLLYVSDQLQKAVLGFPPRLDAPNPPPTVTIPLGVIPEGVWVDNAGVLYVAVSGVSPTKSGAVEEFKPGATAPFKTITDGITVPAAVIVDSGGNLYVSQTFDTAVQIVEYANGSTSPFATYTIEGKSEPRAGSMTFDQNQYLYVDTLFVDDPPARVYQIIPGNPKVHALQMKGRGRYVGISSDAGQHLYAADAADGIAQYDFQHTMPIGKIVPPSGASFAQFVVTRAGLIYVPNETASPSASSLLEYRGLGTKPANILSGHLQAPFSAAILTAAF